MRKTKLFTLIQALLFLGGCANPTLMAPVNPQANGQPVASTPAQSPAQGNTTSPVTTAANLTGKAQILDQPMAGASVSVYELGSTTPLVTGTAGADGSFALTVPSLQSATVYKIVATKGNQHLVSLYQAGATASSFRVASVDSALLTLATTVAYELLAPRLEASGKLQRHDKAIALSAFTTFNKLASGEEGLVTQPGTVANEVLSGLNTNGLLTLQSDSLRALGAHASSLELQAFQQAAAQLGQLLAAAVESGVHLDLTATGSLIFGASFTTSITGGSGGGSSSSSSQTITANVHVVGPAAGSFQGPLGAENLAFKYPAGTVLGTYTVGGSPETVAVDGSGNLWVPDYNTNQVTELSSTGSVLGTYPVGNGPWGVAVDGSGNVWVGNYSDGSVTELSSTGSVLGTYTITGNTDAVAVDRNSGNVWVTSSTPGTVTELTSTGSVLGSYTVGTSPSGVAVDGNGNVWVPDNSSDVVMELTSTGSVLGTYTVGSGPEAVALDGSGNAWVPSDDGNLTELSSTGSVIGTYAIGIQAYGVAVDANGHVWLPDNNGNAAVEVSSTGSVLGSFTVGNSPYAVAVDGNGHVWVANQSDGTFTELAD